MEDLSQDNLATLAIRLKLIANLMMKLSTEAPQTRDEQMPDAARKASRIVNEIVSRWGF